MFKFEALSANGDRDLEPRSFGAVFSHFAVFFSIDNCRCDAGDYLS